VYARIWWKEARTLGPVWVTLVVFACGLDVLLCIFTGGKALQSGGLILTSFALATLYAFAAGAVAFAGERENKTLVLLDVLPISRAQLWLSKTVFAVVSTIALPTILTVLVGIGILGWKLWQLSSFLTLRSITLLLLLGIAVAGLVRLRRKRGLSHQRILRIVLITLGLFVTSLCWIWINVFAWFSLKVNPSVLSPSLQLASLMVEALAWGLFWSAALNSSLTAAILAMVSVATVTLGTANIYGVWLWDSPWTGPWRLVPALGALAASRLVFLRQSESRTSAPLMPEFSRVPRYRRRRGLWGRSAPRDEVPPSQGTGRFPVVRRLVWETCCEAGTIWLIVLAVSLILPLFTSLYDVALIVIGFPLLTLWAGVSIFGLENRARTYRFYLHHGVRPGVVWSVKVTLWTAALFVIAPVAVWALSMTAWSRRPIRPEDVLLALYFILYAFALGEFCGLVIRRAVTAGAIASLLFLLLIWPHWLLIQNLMIPEWTVVLPPLMLLAISWAWSGDWMNDQGGAGRWWRLALLVFVPFSSLLPPYIGYRAWSIPAIGPPFDIQEFRSEVPLDQNSAEVYRRAMNSLWNSSIPLLNHGSEIHEAIDRGWNPENQVAVDAWRNNQDAIAAVRRAAAMPRATFHFASGSGAWKDHDLQGMRALVRLMELDLRERMARGDLAGAWDDLHVLFQMAAQMTVKAEEFQRQGGLHFQRLALQLARSWAVDPRQTHERLQTALRDFRQFPTPRPPSELIKATYAANVQTLELPDNRFGGISAVWSMLSFLWGEPPAWERERARRVARLMTADLLQYIDNDPWQQPGPAVWIPERSGGHFSGVGLIDLHWPPDHPVWHRTVKQLNADLESTPLQATLSLPSAHDTESEWFNVVDRRAFELFLALQAWRLGHGGKYPETLKELIPSELSSLPLDPYSGKPFRYGRSPGETVPERLEGWAAFVRSAPAKPGQWVLWSVGPGGTDEGARYRYVPGKGGDLNYTLPDPRPTP
jgi:hypothetical protein